MPMASITTGSYEYSWYRTFKKTPRFSRNCSGTGTAFIWPLAFAFVVIIFLFVFTTATQLMVSVVPTIDLSREKKKEFMRRLHAFEHPLPPMPTPPHELRLYPKNEESPYRFRATDRMLSYDDTDNEDTDTDEGNLFKELKEYITSVDDFQSYRKKTAPLIPTEEPVVYFITPTHARDTQMADLITLGQTLALNGNIYWIVVEDGTECTREIRMLLLRLGLPYAHVAVPTSRVVQPKNNLATTTFKKREKLPNHRGIDQRNKGLEIIEALLKEQDPANTVMDGVVYFGDDDNTYDVHLFPQLRRTTTVGVLPVGFVGGGPYERCVVDTSTGKVQTIASAYIYLERKFAMDMAGFCFHTRYLTTRTTTTPRNNRLSLSQKQRSPPRFDWNMADGQLETLFVEQMVKEPSELNALADNCTRLYVWHTKSIPLTTTTTSINSKRRKSLKHDDYVDGIGPRPLPPVLPPHLRHIASRVGGMVVDSKAAVSAPLLSAGTFAEWQLQQQQEGASGDAG